MKTSWSVQLYLWINRQQGKWSALDKIMVWLSRYGIFLLVILVLLYALFVVYPQDAALFRRFINHALFTALLGLVISYSAGLIWRHVRPVRELPRVRQLIHPLGTWKSFPSDHTLLSFITAGSLLFFSGQLSSAIVSGLWLYNGLVAIACLLALFVSLSRVYVGVHYPRDILGGLLLAIVLVYLFLTPEFIGFRLLYYLF